MRSDLDSQLREYSRLMDERQGALSFEDILEQSGELQVVPAEGNRHQSPPPKTIKTTGPQRGLTWAVAAFVVILALGGVYLAFSGDNDQVVDQTTLSTPATVATTVPNPTPAEDEVIYGWPTTRENPAGVYSLDGVRCGEFPVATYSCTLGFMHNGYGSGDVDITIDVGGLEPLEEDDGTQVTLAGHDGTYRQDRNAEIWRVKIEGRTVVATLTVEPGTSQADLDEAHAIIDSIRTEPADNSWGFRVVFTLATDDWDSG